MPLKHLPRHFALWAIRGYQRCLSPYKGFSCAYRVHTGRCGCSAIGHRAIRRYGVVAGLAVLRQRLYLCGVAYRRFTIHKPPSRILYYQRGDCDIPCNGCNLLEILFDLVCELFSDSKKRDSRKKSKEKDESKVYVPPPSGFG